MTGSSTQGIKTVLHPVSDLAEVTAAGATVKEPAHDVGGGRLVATVTDPDGNVLGLLQD
jgi:predicted enzyme related to lactoylglutathione lyase